MKGVKNYRLERSSSIDHPLGDTLHTPLLIPSFSSKSFKFRKEGSKIRSEVIDFVKNLGEALTDPVLISAFDLHHGFVKKPSKNFPLYPQFHFLDSGGYETIDGEDFSEVYKYPSLHMLSPKRELRWNINLYKETLKDWDFEKFPSIIVSYDNGAERRIKLERQIDKAQEFFQDYKNCLHNFLIKPSVKNGFLDVNDIADKASFLRGFDIIGVTEKELGNSLMERMKNIGRLRLALDRTENKAPIHVFGSLDPISCVLYFMAGAEIFDGLTWLRFSYFNGFSLYFYNDFFLQDNFTMNDDYARMTALRNNIVELKRIQYAMKNYLHNEYDLSLFPNMNLEILKKARNTLHTELKL